MRSSAQRTRLAAKLSRGVELARIVLTRTLLARPSLMPLPHAYTYPCIVQLRRRVVKLASPFHLLNASCTALHMHRNTHPLAVHPLAPLSMWTLVHHCFWQASDSVWTTVFTVTLSKKKRASRAFGCCHIINILSLTVHNKLENDLETSNRQTNVIDLTMRTLVTHTNTHTHTHIQ